MTTAPNFVPPVPQPPVKKTHKLRWTLLSFLAVIVLIVIIAVSTSGGTPPAATPAAAPVAPAAKAPAQKAPAAPAVPGIGDKASDGKFQFVVKSVTHAKSVGDTSFGLGATAQGEYTVLNVTVKNIGDQPQTLIDSNQTVFDNKGRKFNADSTADLYLASNGQSAWVSDINPGNSVTGKMAFDLPVGSKATKVELHDSMFSGGVTVNLK